MTLYDHGDHFLRYKCQVTIRCIPETHNNNVCRLHFSLTKEINYNE